MNLRTLTFLLVASTCVLSAEAQSTFVFRNKYGGVDAPVFDSLGVPLAGTDYRAELYGSISPSSLTPTKLFHTGQRAIVPFLAAPNGGYFLDGEVAVNDVLPGMYAWLQVRAWDARLGSTYEDVAALGVGGYGESALFYADGGDPTLFPAELGGPLIGLQSFSLRPVVPEPSALALLGLGGLSLWWTHRKRDF